MMKARYRVSRWGMIVCCLLLCWLASAQMGCLSKVERACNADADCQQLFPNIFCYKGVCSAQACEPADTRTCYSGPEGTAGIGVCRAGTQSCDKNGQWTACIGEVVPGREICDQQDNDCNGKTDEPPKGQKEDWCRCDRPADERICYTGPKETENTGECTTGIQICRKNYLWGPCLDERRPQREVCDGKDNDCNGNIDDSASCACEPGTVQACYSGNSEHLGKGICKPGKQTCSSDRTWGKCEGETLAKSEETCDNDEDDNCDGRIDEGCAKTCRGNTPDVCERRCVNLQTDPNHCGGCGQQIEAGQRCCAGKAIYTLSDSKNCGSCGNQCPESQQCVDGSCQDRCGGLLPLLCTTDNGKSCVNPKTDPIHCGACNKACQPSEQCVVGNCQPRCSGKYPNLCESQCVDQNTDPRHCGSCQKQCKQSEYCDKGECRPFCPPPYTLRCGDTCIDPKTDNEHCGGCGTSCTSKGEFCEQGKCQQCKSNQEVCGSGCCAPGLRCCGGICVDLKNHPQHCGACAQACASKERCNVGSCGCKDGEKRLCYTGASDTLNQGVCRAGLQTCNNGTWSACQGDTTPSKESCNGLDDDCNGTVDDNPDLKRTCPQQGICQGTQAKCVNGVELCDAQGFETTEQSCDGRDNDCDGQVDEDLSSVAPSCKKQQGVCNGAKQRCVLGAWQDCDTLRFEQQETRCDGLDNDCDGQTDENCTSCIATHLVQDTTLPSGSLSVAIHPNGQWLAFGRARGQLWIWANGGYLHKHNSSNLNSIIAVGFTSDGKYILANNSTETIIREVISGSVIGRLTMPVGQRFGKALAISPNNRFVAISQNNHAVGIWDLQRRTRVATLTGHSKEVADLHYNKQGTRLASASKDRSVRIWDTSTYQIIQTITGHNDEVNAVRFIPGKALLASGTGSGFRAGKLRLWDTNNWQLTATIPDANHPSNGLGSTAPIRGLGVSFDGRFIYAAGAQPDYSTRIWDISTPASPVLRRVLRGTRYGMLNMRVSADSQTLIVTNTLETRRWRCPVTCQYSTQQTARNPKVNVHASNVPLNDLFLHPSNTYLYTVGTDNKIKGWSGPFYEVNASSLTTSFVPVQAKYRPYPFIPGPIIVGAGKTLLFWERLHPTAVTTKVSGIQFSLTLNNDLRKILYSPNDTSIAVATNGNTIERFNSATARRSSLSTSGLVDAIAYSTNGKFLASGTQNGQVEIWNDATGSKSVTLGPFTVGAIIQPIAGIAFHPTKDHLVVIAYDKQAEIWDFAGTPKKTVDIGGTNGHTDTITKIVWSPDGQRIATGSLDSSVRLWNAKTGTSELTLPPKTTHAITHLLWTSDGTKIIAGTKGGHTKVWFGNTCSVQ